VSLLQGLKILIVFRFYIFFTCVGLNLVMAVDAGTLFSTLKPVLIAKAIFFFAV